MVPADAAQRLIDDTGLRIAKVPMGRAILSLAFVRYEDSDLGAYHELGVAFYVRGPRGRGVYIHHLPVDQEFTLAAGREIWGYPKFLAEIALEEADDGATCTLRHDGADVLEITVQRGLLPLPQPSLRTYTHLDDTLRVTEWRSRGAARAQLWGASVRLGSHPIADELRSLGLPKPARMTSVRPRFRASFGPAEVLSS